MSRFGRGRYRLSLGLVNETRVIVAVVCLVLAIRFAAWLGGQP